MQIKLIKHLTILATVILSASSSFGIVALTNPGFENPTIGPWAAEGSATIGVSATNVFAGSQSARVDFPAADGSGIHQDMAVSPSDLLRTYTVSYKVLATGFSESVGLRVGLWEFGPTGIVFNQSGYTWVSAGSNGWITVSATFTTTSTNATAFRSVLTVYPQGSPKISGSLWVDNATVQLIPPTLVNPGFENASTSPWQAEQAATIALSATNVSSGSYSALVNFTGEDGDGIFQDIAISPGDRLRTYTVSFQVLASNFSEAVGLKIGLWEFGGPSGIVFNASSYTWVSAGSSNGWITLSANFTTTSTDATYFRPILQVYPQGSPKISGSLWVDNAKLQPFVPAPIALANSGFENPTIDPWLPDGTSISINTNLTYVQSGLQSGQVNFAGTDYTGIKQDFTPSAADYLKSYKASIKVLVPNMTNSVIARLVFWE